MDYEHTRDETHAGNHNPYTALDKNPTSGEIEHDDDDDDDDDDDVDDDDVITENTYLS